MQLDKKSRSRKNAIRTILFVLLLIMLAGATYLGKKGFEELGEHFASANFYVKLATAAPSKSAKAADHSDLSPSVSKMDFAMLQETCPDIVGWIKLQGTAIDYPIVQGKDNDFYLHHLPDRTPNSAGSVMMNYTNDKAFNDDVTILHGHHMRNGSMFNSLENYKDEAFYREHPTIRLFTPTGDYNVSVFAAYTVDGYSYGYPTSFADGKEFDAFIRKATSSTEYETDVQVAFGDRLLLLSTCAYSFEGARYVVIGKINV